MNEDKAMKIVDEKLSAFLDVELPEVEMERIREQLIEDEHLANRLAELAMVDELVAMSYATIDAHPIPNSINKLLVQEEAETAKIIAFPLLQKIKTNLQKNVAIAAGVLLILGFGISQTIHKESNNWQSVAQILEYTPSGVEQLSANGAQIKPQLTFIDKNGDYCRQFSMHDKKDASENIACRQHNSWTLSASAVLDKIQQPGNYQIASGGSILDEKVEQMASGDFFDAQAESIAINQHWTRSK